MTYSSSLRVRAGRAAGGEAALLAAHVTADMTVELFASAAVHTAPE